MRDISLEEGFTIHNLPPIPGRDIYLLVSLSRQDAQRNLWLSRKPSANAPTLGTDQTLKEWETFP
jgi:hypothetical protein